MPGIASIAAAIAPSASFLIDIGLSFMDALHAAEISKNRLNGS
jgi:hypothetical protein